jgi:hypothetical protein
MRYEDLSREDFDAIVTGELTHIAIWLEGEIIDIIADFFTANSAKRCPFTRLLLLRDGLTFQDKIEILRAMTPWFAEAAKEAKLSSVLTRVEEFKAFRNSFAHGRDSSGEVALELKVETVGRSGRPKTITVTPQSHREKLLEADRLLADLRKVRATLAPNP